MGLLRELGESKSPYYVMGLLRNPPRRTPPLRSPENQGCHIVRPCELEGDVAFVHSLSRRQT